MRAQTCGKNCDVSRLSFPMMRRIRGDAKDDLTMFVLIKIIIFRARCRPDIHHHAFKKRLHRLGDGAFMGIGGNRYVDVDGLAELRGKWPGGIDHHGSGVSGFIRGNTDHFAFFAPDFGDSFIKVKLSSQIPGAAIESIHRQQGRNGAVIG